jgi:poly(hydroxyalkanoate) granule-associated protein
LRHSAENKTLDQISDVLEPEGLHNRKYGGLGNMTEELQVVSETIEVVTNGTDQMVLVEEDVETVESKEAGSSMVAMVRKVLQAGVGAFALTKDEVEDFVSKLVERGEIAEQDGRRLVRDVLSRRRHDAEDVATKVQEETHKQVGKVHDETEKQIAKAESMIDQRIEGMLGRLNIPTKHDIDLLSQKIALLADKVDALKN